jgi:hypothetical protein
MLVRHNRKSCPEILDFFFKETPQAGFREIPYNVIDQITLSNDAKTRCMQVIGVVCRRVPNVIMNFTLTAAKCRRLVTMRLPRVTIPFNHLTIRKPPLHFHINIQFRLSKSTNSATSCLASEVKTKPTFCTITQAHIAICLRGSKYIYSISDDYFNNVLPITHVATYGAE